jgi:hypothetical protein
MSESLRALCRANPRRRPGFAESVDAIAPIVRARIEASDVWARRRPQRPYARRRVLGVSALGVCVVAATVAAVFLTVGGSPGVVSGVESAAAAVEKAARVTAASARSSGTAVVSITHDGDTWAGLTIRWNGDDLALARVVPEDLARARGVPQRKPGSDFLVVDGMMYGLDENGDWAQLGSPDSIDPDSGETPAEYLAAVREDVGGATLERITGGIGGLTTRRLEDGSTVYTGTVAAGLIARETGFKEGQAIRVLPFGFVAHDEAADPDSPLETAITVGPDDVVREITVTWGTWTYAVAYSDLGSTPAPIAPAHARPLRETLRAPTAATD